MKQQLRQTPLQIIIRPYKGRYVAMCLEMGLYFEGGAQEVHQKLFSSMTLAFEAVDKDKTLLPSLSIGMNFDQTLFFYWSLFQYQLRRFFFRMQEALVLQANASNIRGLAVCG